MQLRLRNDKTGFFRRNVRVSSTKQGKLEEKCVEGYFQ